MKTRQIILTALIVLTIVLAPILITVIMRIDPPGFLQPVAGNTIKEQTWITFSGAYLGAIISAVGAIMIMMITLRSNRAEKKESRRYQDYLYLRDRLEGYSLSLHDNYLYKSLSVLYDVINDPELLVLPELNLLEETADHVRTEYYKVQRAVKQSINKTDDRVLHDLKSSYGEFEMWYITYYDFIKQTNHYCRLGKKKGMKKAAVMDYLYKRLVEDVQNHNVALQGVVPFTFANCFKEIDHPNPGENLLDGQEYNTDIITAFSNTVVEFRDRFFKCTSSIEETIETTLSHYQKQQVV